MAVVSPSAKPENGGRSGTVLCAGGVLIATFALLAWQSHRLLSVWTLIAALVVAWAMLFAAWRSARHLEARQLLPALWIVAITVRIVGCFAVPLFEDDWFRYLWDGRQLAVFGNPYGRPPSASFADQALPDDFQAILSNINYPEVPTIYGPVCQFAFGLSYWIAPAQLWPLKLILIGADLMALWLLLKFVSPRHALLYAWCPLVIQETAFTAHVEVLGVALMTGALWARLNLRWLLTGALCGGAVAARLPALLLVPFLLWPLQPRTIAAFVATVALLYAPFWWQGGATDLAGFRAFLGQWEFNSSLFALMKGATDWASAKLFCNSVFVILAMAVFGCFVRRARAIVAAEQMAVHALAVLAAFFALSAVVNPWYLLWLAPFTAIRPSLTGAMAMFAVSLSYLQGGHLGWEGLDPFDHPKWLRPLEYGLILAAALFEWRRNLLAAKRKTD